MTQTVQAIVLRRRDSGENDRRLTIYSREEGRMEVIAKGARKSGSRLSGMSEPLAVGNLTLTSGRHQAFVTEAVPLRNFAGIRGDYDRLMAALALAELIGACAPTGQVDSEYFDLLLRLFVVMEGHVNPDLALAWALLQTMAWEGIIPSFTLCVRTERPIKMNPAWFSPSAGGFLDPSISDEFRDAFPVRAEVLYGLNQLSTLDTPPKRMKYLDEVPPVLYRIALEMAHGALPSFEAYVQHRITSVNMESL